MSGLCIQSDFSDYYDIVSDKNSIITYHRYLRDCRQRGSALKFLRNVGIKTIDVKPVSTFLRGDGPIVVYKDPTQHHGHGKIIATVDEAMSAYQNYAASKYCMNSNLTIKYLQIGKRRLTLYFEKKNSVSLDIGTLVDIRESSPEYNRLFGLPIFSIDYVSNGIEMLATDFNEVENLQLLGLERYISATEIESEIKEALVVYNKI